MAPHRDDLEAAQQRIRALEDRVEELEAEKHAPPEPPAPAAPPKDRVAARIARAKKLTRDAERAAAEGEQMAEQMRAVADRALATHPTSKDVVVTLLGGGGVAFVSFFVNATLFAPRGPAPVPMMVLAVAIVLQSIAIPRVFHPAPLFRTRSDDGQTYSPGIRLAPGKWAFLALFALVVDVLVHLVGA